MWPRGPLVSLRALADTCRTQVPGRDGSRSDRTAGASYGAVSREVSDAGTSVLSVPATPSPWSLVPLLLGTGALSASLGRRALPSSGRKVGRKVDTVCPTSSLPWDPRLCAHTRSSVGLRGPAAPTPSSGWFSAGGLDLRFQGALRDLV